MTLSFYIVFKAKVAWNEGGKAMIFKALKKYLISQQQLKLHSAQIKKYIDSGLLK